MAFLSNRKLLLVFVGDGTREGAVKPVVKGGWGDGLSLSDGAESSGSLRFVAVRTSSSVEEIAISKTNKLQKEGKKLERIRSNGSCFYWARWFWGL